MPFIDTSILISNITKLMNESHTTQLQLAEYIGISQPNVSKALSTTDKKCFTLDQVVGIAKHFNVTVDWLLGIDTSSEAPKTPRSIAKFIIKLIEENELAVTDCQIEEETYELEFTEDGYSRCNHENKVINYKAFYFPSYWHMPTDNISREEYQSLYAEMTQCGNITKHYMTNKTINQIIQLLNIYRSQGLEEDTYRKVVDDLLNHLSDS